MDAEIRLHVIVYYSRNNYTSDKCWDKFGIPKCAIADIMSVSTSATNSSTDASTVQIFKSDYERFF